MMSNKMDSGDSALATLLVQGDMDAFDDIYWKYQRAIYQNALRITRDETAAQDIVQEVFISLWEKRNSINPALPLAGWLFVSSYNRSISLLKKKLRESVLMDHFTVDESESELGAEISELQLLVLDQAISLLSPQKRRVFELCKLQGKSYEETATELHISKHTVKEYLSEAVSTVKAYILKHPILPVAILSGAFDGIF